MSDRECKIYESITEVNENQWNNVVKQSGHGSLFHRAEWLRAVERTLDGTARHFVVEKGGNPVAILPNFVVDIDVPFSTPAFLDQFDVKRMSSSNPGFGGPLFVGSERSNFDLMFGHIDRLLSDRRVIQHHVRTVDDGSIRYGRPFKRHGYDLAAKSCRFTIDLERGWESIEANMAKSKRSNLIDARESAATVEERPLEGTTLDEFYAKYEKAMERVDGVVYPPEFFERLQAELGEDVKLFTVDVDGEFAGGRLFLIDDERSAVHAFIRGLDPEFFEYHPTELLDEYAMRWGIERGYDTYDLGSSKPDFDYGPFKYKQELGAHPRPVLSWERGCSTLGWPAYRVGRWVYDSQLS